jgi:hypothetical protein
MRVVSDFADFSLPAFATATFSIVVPFFYAVAIRRHRHEA